jgi:hypothetical protein
MVQFIALKKHHRQDMFLQEDFILFITAYLVALSLAYTV